MKLRASKVFPISVRILIISQVWHQRAALIQPHAEPT